MQIRQIDELWKLRWNQEIESCLHALPELQQLARMDKDNLEEQIQKIDAKLLINSLERVRGRVNQFHLDLEKIENNTNRSILSRSRYFAFEKAISSYLKQDFLVDLENFVRFRNSATLDSEKAMCLMNEVFCLDNLGFPFDQTLQKLDAILANSPHPNTAPFPAIFAQRNYFKLNQSFQKGDFSSLKINEGDQFDQAKYFSLWITALPYHTLYDPDQSKKMTEAFTHRPYFFQKNYRARTLIDNTFQNASDSTRFTDIAERCYLWTWRWLIEPNARNANLVLQSTQEVFKNFNQGSISPSDLALIKNSVNWILIFAPTFEENHRIVIQEILSLKLPKSLPLFEYEELIQTKVVSKIKKNELLTDESILMSHPLHQNSLIKMYSLINSKKIDQSVQQILQVTQVGVIKSKVKIKALPNQNKVLLKNGETIISEPLCRALIKINQSEECRIAEFAKDVFGIQNYDEFIHLPKVMNLLSRIKNLAKTQIKIKTKQQTIYSEIKHEFIMIHQDNPHAQSLKDSPLWFETSYLNDSIQNKATPQSLPHAHAIEHLARSQFDRKFSRKELTAFIGGSRASAIRRINNLITENKIIRYAKGKSTYYVFKKGPE